MDISYDSTLIVTGSADKNVRIWGLDFGDCHKSLFAHDDTVMQVGRRKGGEEEGGEEGRRGRKERKRREERGERREGERREGERGGGKEGSMWTRM
jgi:hypothetical protein